MGSKRGFATMDPALQREIASKGGKSAHAMGKAHKWKAGSEEAKAAGYKGGMASARKLKEKGAPKTLETSIDPKATPDPGVVLAMAGGNSLARFGDNSPPEGE